VACGVAGLFLWQFLIIVFSVWQAMKFAMLTHLDSH
jgi:hypothetical protein